MYHMHLNTSKQHIGKKDKVFLFFFLIYYINRVHVPVGIEEEEQKNFNLILDFLVRLLIWKRTRVFMTYCEVDGFQSMKSFLQKIDLAARSMTRKSK